MPRKKNEPPPEPRWSPHEPRLSELVSVVVHLRSGEFHDVLLTRVPAIGEEIVDGITAYRVTRVQHNPLDVSGRSFLGWHAMVDADVISAD